MRRRFFLCVWLVIVQCAANVRAQQVVPDDAVAWALIDGARLGPSTDADSQRRVVQSIASWFGTDRLIKDERTNQLVVDFCADALIRGRRFTICIFELREHRIPARDVTDADVRYSAVISVAADDPDQVAARLAELFGAGRPIEDAPDGVIATKYRDHEWPEWRCIAAATVGTETHIGIGDGERALRRWLSPGREATVANPLRLHRQAVEKARRSSAPVAEAFVNINALRRSFPARFGNDAAARTLAALSLANARSFMFHVRVSSKEGEDTGALLIDATWSMRSESPAVIHRMPLSEIASQQSTGTTDLHATMTPALRAWIARVLDIQHAALDTRDAAEFQRCRRAWEAKRLPVLARVESAIQPTLTVSIDHTGTGCALGALVCRVRLRSDVKRDAWLRDFRSLFDPFSEWIATDDGRQSWRLLPRQPSLIRAVQWRMDDNDLIVSVDLGMENNRPER